MGPSLPHLHPTRGKSAAQSTSCLRSVLRALADTLSHRERLALSPIANWIVLTLAPGGYEYTVDILISRYLSRYSSPIGHYSNFHSQLIGTNGLR